MKPEFLRWSVLTAILAVGPAVAQVATATSDKGRLQKSGEFVEEMRGALKRVLQILDEARSDKDLVKLACVNEKITQIKGLLKVSEQSEVDLKEAITAQDKDAIEHNATKINIARERILQLEEEAEQCIGQLAYVIDEKTVVEIISPEGLPADDPTVVPPLPPPVTRPPPASPEKP